MGHQTYNASFSMKFLRRVSGWFASVLMFATLAVAADWSKAVGDLAKAIAGETGPGTISMSVVDASSLAKDQVTEIQRGLETQLRASGIRLGSGTSVNSAVKVTLSESLREYVWVAEITEGNETRVQMVTMPRESGSVIARTGPAVEIRKALMWSQREPMLDMVVVDGATPTPHLVILGTETLESYALASGKWKLEQRWNLTHVRSFPRDLRGLLVVNANRSVDAYLPGTVCSVANVNANAVVCRDSDDAWKIGPRAAFFNSSRNYFTGALVPASDKAIGPFYSAAWLERQGYPLMMVSGVDGRFRVSDGVNERILSPSVTADWGSDIAAVKTGCGSGSQVLVTLTGDDTKPDSLRAFDIADREPVLVSAVVDFAGPVMALWSHDAAGAVTIVRNLRTGQYEAYSISILCTQ